MSDFFESDEMQMLPVPQHWSADELLAAQGIFYLKDVVRKLRLDTTLVKRHAKLLESKDETPWVVMGVRKVWSHWIVRMTVFAPYYREHLKSDVAVIESDWDGNTLLQQEGIFALTDVCKHLPFSATQIRYQAKKRANPREEVGVWKDEKQNKYLVEMRVFAKWIKGLWRE